MQYLLFTIDEQLFGFDLNYVDRVTPSVEITSLPKAPSYYEGMINLHGKVIPVVCLRKMLGLETRELDLSDQFLICHLNSNSVAIWIDKVIGIRDYSKTSLIPAKEVFSNIENVEFVAKENDSLVLLYNIKNLLEEICSYDQSILS